MSSNNTQSTTSTATVRKCGICRTPGHDRRKCPTLDTVVAPVVAAPTPTDSVDFEITFDLIAPPVVKAPTQKYKVGCSMTSPYGVVTEATLEEYADMMLHCHDMWADSGDVVLGMRKTYKVPEVSNPTTGTVSAYESAQCPCCRAVYSGADIEAHLHTHTATDLLAGAARIEADMSERIAYARTYDCRGLSYMSESMGLADTTELSDSHVRESGMFLTVEPIVHPVGKCKCMSSDVDENPLVSEKGIDGGKEYTCTHGTTWQEVWETTYTHARWDHLRDSHLQERTYSDNIGHFGSNPIFAYLSAQSKTRVDRCEQIIQWVKRAPLKHILTQRSENTLKVRRNRTVSAAVGFETTPEGKWDGVSGSDICGLVRHTEITIPYIMTQGKAKGASVVEKTTCTRIADWSGIYLTKDQFDYINTLVEKRVKGESLAPVSTLVAVAPTVRASVVTERTPGDILLRSRLMCAALRQDAIKWDSADHNPHGSTGVPMYVPSADVAEMSTLGYLQVYSHPLPQ